MRIRPVLFVAAVGLLASSSVVIRSGVTLPNQAEAPPAVDLQATESTVLLIDLADHLTLDERAVFLAELPGEPRLNSAYSQQEGLYRVELADDLVDAWVSRLDGDPRVEFVEPEWTYSLVDPVPAAAEAAPDNSVHRGPSQPDDPLYRFQWNFEQVGAAGAWEHSAGNGVVVAVIDTGVAFTNDPSRRLSQVRDLAGTRFVPGFDFVSDNDRPLDEHGHGTHVAGTIAQSTNNGYGVAGLAPASTIMPIRVLDASGRGNTADIAESIRWAADHGAHIINMSLGGPLPSRIMTDAIEYAHRRGVTIIAAAGNAGSQLPSYPAAYNHVVSVAATQFDRSTTFYSNFGRTIDVAAPGGNTRVDQNEDGRPDGIMQETLAHGDVSRHDFSLYMGTSMASPHVAAVAALIRARGVTDPDRIEAILKSTATQEVPGYTTNKYGAGLVQADAALKAATSRAPFGGAVAGLLAGLALLATAGAGLSRRTAALPVLGTATAAGLAWMVSAPWNAAFCEGGAALMSAMPWLTSAPLLSAAVPLAMYALAGHTSGRARFALLGTVAGFGSFLLALALWPTVDVTGVPGAGLLDELWLISNATLALGLVALALRPADGVGTLES